MIFGRPETFAIEVSALGEGPSDKEPVAAATWTALKMFVKGRNLFRNVRRDSGETSHSVNWPSVYLARWLVVFWGPIYHTPPWPKPITFRNARDVATTLDEELADNYDVSDDALDARDEFIQAHSLRAAAAGAAMPDAWFSRDGDVVSVAWSNSLDGDLSFPLERGEADIPAIDFAEAARGFVAWVRTILVDANLQEAEPDLVKFDEWLEEFSSLYGAQAALLSETGLTKDRLDSIKAATGIQADAELFDLPSEWFHSGTLANVRQSPIAVAFRCVAPAVTEDDLIRIRETFLASPRDDSSFKRLKELADLVAVPSPSLHDFVRGYHLARALRKRLKNISDPLDIEGLVSELSIGVTELKLSDQLIDGGCICDEGHGPAIFLNPSSARAATSWGKRIILAHELCHLLFDRTEAKRIGIFSGPWAPPRVERVANAFAVELLLPLAGIVATVGPIWDQTTDEHLGILMNKYALGLTAVSEHVRNMRRWSNR